MSGAQLRFVVLEQGVGAAIFNFVLNAGIAWLSFRAFARVPLWGVQSAAADTLGTAFVLPLLTSLIVTRIVQIRILRGGLEALAWRRRTHSLLGRLSASPLRRGLVLGLAGVVIAAPPGLLILSRWGVEPMSLREFIVFKASFAAALALVVTPLVALCALGDAPVKRP